MTTYVVRSTTDLVPYLVNSPDGTLEGAAREFVEKHTNVQDGFEYEVIVEWVYRTPGYHTLVQSHRIIAVTPTLTFELKTRTVQQ